jgi:hypothetical protein
MRSHCRRRTCGTSPKTMSCGRAASCPQPTLARYGKSAQLPCAAVESGGLISWLYADNSARNVWDWGGTVGRGGGIRHAHEAHLAHLRGLQPRDVVYGLRGRCIRRWIWAPHARRVSHGSHAQCCAGRKACVTPSGCWNRLHGALEELDCGMLAALECVKSF